VVSGSAVFLAADYYAGSSVIENCVSNILRYFYSGFDGVLIGVPSEEVKDQILHEIDSKIADRLGIRRNIAVVVIGQQEKKGGQMKLKVNQIVSANECKREIIY